jgi:hypothetical protein
LAHQECWQAAWAALSSESTDGEQSMVAELRTYVARQVGFEEGE